MRPALPLIQTQRSGTPINLRADPVTTNTITYTIRAGLVLDLSTFTVTFTSDANLGNRTIAMTVTGPEHTVIFQDHPTIAQADALTRYYTWAVGAQTGAAFAGANLLRGLPPMVLIPGTTITVWDEAGIAATDTIPSLALHGWGLTDVSVLEGLREYGIYTSLGIGMGR